MAAKDDDEDSKKALLALADWKPKGSETEIDALAANTERSLKEVKALTEYEDTKAQRILTAIAFLAAFAGAVFAVTNKSIADAGNIPTTSAEWFSRYGVLLIATYGGFAIYALLLTYGATRVIYAIKPRFEIDWGGLP